MATRPLDPDGRRSRPFRLLQKKKTQLAASRPLTTSLRHAFDWNSETKSDAEYNVLSTTSNKDQRNKRSEQKKKKIEVILAYRHFIIGISSMAYRWQHRQEWSKQQQKENHFAQLPLVREFERRAFTTVPQLPALLRASAVGHQVGPFI
ncbi:hypothetical protein CEXT_721861 [Caerostris extrusa]|uniref:Uncharacterized protein n=1 Tax=Caerostris extrusa TaxID=172846 RepID=A0AAV4R6T1_CAEEX|nr:hypothetical protein CEXT_721861 [Caerostris extrusa]